MRCNDPIDIDWPGEAVDIDWPDQVVDVCDPITVAPAEPGQGLGPLFADKKNSMWLALI